MLAGCSHVTSEQHFRVHHGDFTENVLVHARQPRSDFVQLGHYLSVRVERIHDKAHYLLVDRLHVHEVPSCQEFGIGLVSPAHTIQSTRREEAGIKGFENSISGYEELLAVNALTTTAQLLQCKVILR